MNITVNPRTFVISIAKSELALIQETPTEIRQLNLNEFRLSLKSWEDNEEGIIMPKTHNHYPESTVGGVALSRVIVLLAPYTVTFEDGQYAVNLTGANSNVGDRVNVNQVSVRSANSAGLQTVTSGSGVTEQDKLDIANRVWTESVTGYTASGTFGHIINKKVLTIAKFLGLK